MKSSLIFATILLSFSALSNTSSSISQSGIARQDIALIYKGPGSCENSTKTTGCSEAAALIAKMAGMQVEFVGPNGLKDRSLWQRASVWIQPGGRARKQIQAMQPALLQDIRDFVDKGGGYVGFCAGAFLAGQKFGWLDPIEPKNSFEASSIGLIAGYVQYFGEYDNELTDDLLAKILTVDWGGTKREVYWELGPYFDKSTLDTNRYEVLAYYHDSAGAARLDHAMTLRGNYGSGRVFLTAVHPEAPQDWRDWYKLADADGLDEGLAAEMVKWAAKLTP